MPNSATIWRHLAAATPPMMSWIVMSYSWVPVSGIAHQARPIPLRPGQTAARILTDERYAKPG